MSYFQKKCEKKINRTLCSVLRYLLVLLSAGTVIFLITWEIAGFYL